MELESLVSSPRHVSEDNDNKILEDFNQEAVVRKKKVKKEVPIKV